MPGERGREGDDDVDHGLYGGQQCAHELSAEPGDHADEGGRLHHELPDRLPQADEGRGELDEHVAEELDTHHELPGQHVRQRSYDRRQLREDRGERRLKSLAQRLNDRRERGEHGLRGAEQRHQRRQKTGRQLSDHGQHRCQCLDKYADSRGCGLEHGTERADDR